MSDTSEARPNEQDVSGGDEPGVTEQAAPFFIVGFQRSGTTLLRMMLNSHPRVAIPHDSAELWPSYRNRQAAYNMLQTQEDVLRMMNDIHREPRIQAWQTDLPKSELYRTPLPKNYAEIMSRFHEVFMHLQGKDVWGDKNTGTLVEMDDLNFLFPTAKFVHLVRDGRDCALSHTGAVYKYGYANILRVAQEWRDQVGLCGRMGRMLPSWRFMEVRYEDLIRSPKEVLLRICEFLGLEYSDQMLRYHENVEKHIPSEKQSLWPLINRPPDVSNVDRWKTHMSLVDRAIFERTAGELLAVYGYETLQRPIRKGKARQLWYEIHQRVAWRFRNNKIAKKGKGS